MASVTSPLKRQFGQIPGLSRMTSTCSFGSSIITLQFTLALGGGTGSELLRPLGITIVGG